MFVSCGIGTDRSGSRCVADLPVVLLVKRDPGCGRLYAPHHLGGSDLFGKCFSDVECSSFEGQSQDCCRLFNLCQSFNLPNLLYCTKVDTIRFSGTLNR